MNYNEALTYIHKTLKFGIKLGLENIRVLLELLGNPHKNLHFIHIAGTNGKGSTAAFINSILIEAGYKTGLFTSPYIQRFTERIKINNNEISENNICHLTKIVKDKVKQMIRLGYNHPTEFEIVTAIAFLYYSQNNCDIVVLETGLGGRFDSTNIIEAPLACVITSISYDHTDKLGKSIEEIAFEKAGIIKKNSDVILYPQHKDAEKVFDNICKKQQAILHKIDLSPLTVLSFDIDGQNFDYKKYNTLHISLLGEHQIKNAIIAINTIEILKQKSFTIPDKAIRNGLLNAKWPGRFEILKKAPVLIIDGAHNSEGAKILAHTLEQYFPKAKKTIIMGVLKDKDVNALINAILPVADNFITVTPKSDRALPAEELTALIAAHEKKVKTACSISEAIKYALNMKENYIICAFGSLYYIGEIRTFLGIQT